MAWGARTLISTQVGFDITPEQMANDLAIMKAALPSKKTLVYGVLNQDSDQDKTTVTDPIYQASKDSIDIVAFSYYMNNAWRRAPENHGSYSGSGRCEALLRPPGACVSIMPRPSGAPPD